MVVKASAIWATPPVLINDASGNDIAAIPIDFLTEASLKCEYLAYVAQTIVKEGGFLFRDGSECVLSEPIREGVYIWMASDPRTFNPGPEGKSHANPIKVHNIDADESTWSRSSRNSTGQNLFRMQSLARDGLCLVTSSMDLESLQGCHIAPKSRGNELVEELCGPGLTRSVDSVQNALTLRADVHHLFDKYKFGIYTKDGEYIIHSFTSLDIMQYHGRRLRLRQERDFFRIFPDKRLLEWHYRQCILARFRKD